MVNIMNKAQKFLLDEKLNDLVLTNLGVRPYIYTSDTLIKFAAISVCKSCAHFEEHTAGSVEASDGMCNNGRIFVDECNFDFGCNEFK